MQAILHQPWLAVKTLPFLLTVLLLLPLPPQEVEEVEVWLHADDSCLFSYQSGAFITHLLPRATAAGWDTSAAAAAEAAAAAAGGSPVRRSTATPREGHSSSLAECCVPVQGTCSISAWHEANNAAAVSAAGYDDVDGDGGKNDLVAHLGMQLHRLRLPPAAASASAAADVAARSAGVSSLPRTATTATAALADTADTAGLVDGAVDASQMSRVYAASALPELPVAAVAGGGGSIAACCGGPALKLPVGQVAARALKFR